MDHCVGHLADGAELFLADDLGDVTRVGLAEIFTHVAEEPEHGMPGGAREDLQENFLADATEMDGAIGDGGGAATGAVEHAELAEVICGALVGDGLGGTARVFFGQRHPAGEHEVDGVRNLVLLEDDGFVRIADQGDRFGELGALRGGEVADERVRAYIHVPGSKAVRRLRRKLLPSEG